MVIGRLTGGPRCERRLRATRLGKWAESKMPARWRALRKFQGERIQQWMSGSEPESGAARRGYGATARRVTQSRFPTGRSHYEGLFGAVQARK